MSVPEVLFAPPSVVSAEEFMRDVDPEEFMRDMEGCSDPVKHRMGGSQPHANLVRYIE